jgi:hypothetical protein
VSDRGCPLGTVCDPPLWHMSGTAVGKRDVPLLLPPAFRVKVIPGMFRIMASCCRATRSCSARSELARIRILEGQAGCEMGMSDRPGYPGPSGPVEWLSHRHSAVLGWQGGVKKSMSSWLTRSALS